MSMEPPHLFGKFDQIEEDFETLDSFLFSVNLGVAVGDSVFLQGLDGTHKVPVYRVPQFTSRYGISLDQGATFAASFFHGNFP